MLIIVGIYLETLMLEDKEKQPLIALVTLPVLVLTIMTMEEYL